MFAWTSQRSGNASITSDNPESPWYDGGVQTARASVPGASGTDSLTIAQGHVVTWDYNMTGGNLSSLVINGTLQASTSPGTYSIAMTGISGNNITINSGGVLRAGTSLASPYPSDCVFTINLGGGDSRIVCNSGSTLDLFCTEPTWNALRFSGASAGGTELNITEFRRTSDGVFEMDKDLTTDGQWAAGRDVAVVHLRAGSSDIEFRTIASVSATKITLTAGLTNAKAAGSLVVLLWRNVRVVNHVAASTVGAITTPRTSFACYSETTGGRAVLNNYGDVVGGCYVGRTSIAVHPSTGWIKAPAVIVSPGSAIAPNGTSNVVALDGHVLLAAANGLANAHWCRVVGTPYICGCSNAVSWSFIEGSDGITIEGCQTALLNASLRVPRVEITNCANGWNQANAVRVYGGRNDATTQCTNYRDSCRSQGVNSVVHWNIGDVPGAVKWWGPGGYGESVATKPDNWPVAVDHDWSYQHTFEVATQPNYLDKPIYARKGEKITIDVYCKMSTTGMTTRGTAMLVTPDDVEPLAESPLASATMADNTDWQKLTLEYTPTYDRELRLRVYGANASGTLIWREVVTIGGGGGSIFGGLIVR